jgi:hypothetical protein
MVWDGRYLRSIGASERRNLYTRKVGERGRSLPLRLNLAPIRNHWPGRGLGIERHRLISGSAQLDVMPSHSDLTADG